MEKVWLNVPLRKTGKVHGQRFQKGNKNYLGHFTNTFNINTGVKYHNDFTIMSFYSRIMQKSTTGVI
jgi:DNA gyrase/topoisomerase IV subunit B